MYIKQEFGRSLVVVENEAKKDEDYLLSMITENEIEGLLSCRRSHEGRKETLMYDVTNMMSLSREYEGRNMGFKDIKEIFETLKMIYAEGGKYLLDDRYYVLDPEYIYRDVQNDCIRLLYVPGYGRNEKNAYHLLADFFLQKVDRKDNACIQVAYQFYRMSGSDTFSVPMFLSIIHKEEIIQSREAILPDDEQEKESTAVCGSVEIEDKEKVKLWVKSAIMGAVCLAACGVRFLYDGIYAMYLTLASIAFGLAAICCLIKAVVKFVSIKKEESIVIPQEKISVEQYWGSDEETVVFNEETQVFSQQQDDTDNGEIRLEWKENNVVKKYRIREFPVVIGKMIGEVDCRIADSSISRLHAKIIKRENRLLIFDLNSTNGTSVDGVRLSPGQESIVTMDSMILLGNVRLRLV